MVKVCQMCGRQYEVYKSGSKFCGRACSSAAKMVRAQAALRPKACAACGRTFLVAANRASRHAPSPTQRFCSMACQALARYRKGSVSRTMTPTEAAYLAGFIDGEGSVMLYRRRDSVALRVTAANTHLATLKNIAKLCGCGGVVHFDRGNPKHKPAGWWQVNAEAAASMLKQIRPYMFTKRQQADLALDFQERLRDPAMKADRSWQLTYLERMKSLNRRGPAA